MSSQTIAHIRWVRLNSDGAPINAAKVVIQPTRPHPLTIAGRPKPLKA